MCVCTPSIRTPWCGQHDCQPPGIASTIRVRQKPVETEAVSIDTLRRRIITSTWKRTLPQWLVDAITAGIVFIHWEKTIVDGVPAFLDDWIVYQPGGSLAVYRPEIFAAAFEVLHA
jgi:hypothetical protein